MRHTPRKRFGQNFLQDPGVIHSIIQAIHPALTDNIVEIGPGLGALTLPLSARVNALKAIEIDRDLQKYLQTLPEGREKLCLYAEDALTFNYRSLGLKLRVVGNLPYQISTPLLLHLLQFKDCIQDMHFMLQKEVVMRLAGMPHTKAYGRLSVMLQYHYKVEWLFDVPPSAFNPPPKVQSAFVRLTPYDAPRYAPVDTASLEKLLAKAFAMRRKTLANNLKGILSAKELALIQIDANLRAEQLSIEDFVRMTQLMEKVCFDIKKST